MPSVQDVVDFFRVYYHEWGYYLVFFGALLENLAFVGIVWPGGVIVLAGAVYARLGDLSMPLVVLLAWTGGLIGTITNYAIGRTLTPRSVDVLAGRVSRLVHRQRWLRQSVGRLWPAARADDPRVLQATIENGLLRLTDEIVRHGATILIGSQAVGNARTIVALAAGAARYPFGPFLIIQIIGNLASTVMIALIGYLIGGSLAENADWLRWLNVALIALALAVWTQRGRAVHLLARVAGRGHPAQGMAGSASARSPAAQAESADRDQSSMTRRSAE